MAYQKGEIMFLLSLAALLPPFYLMRYIYRQDKVEREPVGLVFRTVLFGVISIFPTMIVEGVLIGILNRAVPDTTILGLLLENMIGVALVEEFFKMQACKLSVWRNPEFNYTFDGIVYSVAAAIGFAAFENLMYVFDGGLATALARAITAIPGHTIFGIFMGMHLGIAKYQEVRGNRASASRHKRLALLVPMVLHGLYDFICSLNSEVGMVIFFVGLIILDIIAIRNVKAFGANDTPIY